MSGEHVQEHPSARDARAHQGTAAAAVSCTVERCGQPQRGPGRPRKGWVQLKAAGEQVALWFCSWHCTSRHALRRELRGDA